MEEGTVTRQQRYTVPDGLSREWFEHMSSIAMTSAPIDCSVRGYVRGASDIDAQTIFSRADQWADYVIARWPDVVESEIWLGRGSIRRVVSDHRRQSVMLEVEAADLLTLDRLLDQYATVLKLSMADRQPYRYRRSAADFAIGRWSPAAFAKGVRAVADLLGGHPALREAYIKTFDGDLEKLTPFYEIDEFVAYLRAGASRFGEAVIGMEGSGHAVGIRVTTDHKLLRLRTSIPPDALGPVIDAWPEILQLNPMKAIDTGSDMTSASPPPDKAILRYGVPVLVAFITAASLSGVVTIKNLGWPEYQVVVTSPPSNHGLATIHGPTAVFSWYLKPQQLWLRGVRTDAAATIRIVGPDGAIKTMGDAAPHAAVDLAPGDYSVEIESPAAEPETILLHVESGTLSRRP